MDRVNIEFGEPGTMQGLPRSKNLKKGVGGPVPETQGDGGAVPASDIDDDTACDQGDGGAVLASDIDDIALGFIDCGLACSHESPFKLLRGTASAFDALA